MGKSVLVPFQKYVPDRPCIRCLYFYICGDSSRTSPCRDKVSKTSENAKKKLVEVANYETCRRR